MDTAPDLLPYMDFTEYEEIYRSWRAGVRTLDQVVTQYGAEVAELLQAQKAVGDAEDEECKLAPEQDVMDPGDGGSLSSVEDVGSAGTCGQSPLCAPGQPRLGFGFFENMYGQWKQGLRSSRDVEHAFGTVWLALFEMWKKWGLDAINQQLQGELNMMEGAAEGVTSIISEQPVVTLPLKVPMSVVRGVFHQWRACCLPDRDVVGRYGEVWLVLFRLMQEQGLSRVVRESLDEHVNWDVESLDIVESSVMRMVNDTVPESEDLPEPGGELHQQG